MKIERSPLPRSSIEDFADKHDLIMEVHERSPYPSPNRFYAHFKRVSQVGDGVLIGTYGNGASEAEAISDYAAKISSKLLRVEPTDRKPFDIVVPVLVGGEQ